ncbi:BlaI/MecI/CopY family transcriptional regulator [Phycisphaerales bacterium AB-hyl4]|uniref:BlaI/MecI/CopY family transcriptional regulator n=1 Tax=Natronomicrosphaera hydrolytica TaxID=3242702 RepID=A0ABV4U8R8_9BACT
MSRDQHQHLSRRERQIMDVIYARGEANVNEIQPGLPDPPTHTAVRTLLKILGDKGLVTREKCGREYVYRPKTRRSRVGQSALQNVIQTFFDGSLEKAVGAHLATHKAKLSTDELDRLQAMIDEARRKKA